MTFNLPPDCVLIKLFTFLVYIFTWRGSPGVSLDVLEPRTEPLDGRFIICFGMCRLKPATLILNSSEHIQHIDIHVSQNINTEMS